MIKFSKVQEVFLVIILAICFVFILFPSVVKSPNSYMFSNTGDGLKNYYNVSYYVKYDQGLHFSGLQYPYGTHIVFTDNQPSIAYPLNLLRVYGGIDLSNYAVGILNYAMLISIVLCALYLFLILRYFKISLIFSLLFALLITFMSPQLYRLGGHYALSYVFFIPMLWYLLLTKERKSNLLNFIYLFGLLLFIAFIHPYMLLIGSIFVLAYTLVYYLYHKSTFLNEKYLYLVLVSSALLPMVVFQMFLKLTDTVADRPQSPWGLMDYRSVFEGLFLPINGLLRDWLSPLFDTWFMKLFFNLNYQIIESNSYLGLVALAFLVFILRRIYLHIKTKKYKRVLIPVLPRELSISLYCSFFVLLFSMAYPFRLGMEFLLELLPPLKQFRSLGRFAWVFYYIFSVGMSYYIYLLYRIIKRSNLMKANIFIGLIVFVWGFEVIQSAINYVPVFGDNCLSSEALDKSPLGLNTGNYQCILTLPLYIAGTEKVERNAPANLKKEASILAYQYHLPMISGDLSRTSIAAGQLIRQTVSNAMIEKPILNDLDKKDAILLVVCKGFYNKDELAILRQSQFVAQYSDSISLYRISPMDIKNMHDALIDQALNNYNQEAHSTLYMSQSFDKAPISTAESFYGKGALLLNDVNENKLSFPVSENLLNKTVELSFWVKLDYTNPNACRFDFSLYNDKKTFATPNITIIDSKCIDLDKGWILAKQRFVIPHEKCTLQITCNLKNIIIDEVLLREINTPTYTHIENNIPQMMNNYRLVKK